MDFLQLYPVTSALIAANVVASLTAFRNRAFLEQNLFVVGPILKARQWHRILTCGFLHGGLGHLAINMITLYFFGPSMERILGGGNYLFLYILALAGGSFWSLLEHRREPNYAALGASGAVSGVLVGFCLFQPFAMLGIFFILPMPAFLFAILYIGLSAYFSTRENTIIGHDAHLGGAIIGGIVTIIMRPEAWPKFIAAVGQAVGGAFGS